MANLKILLIVLAAIVIIFCIIAFVKLMIDIHHEKTRGESPLGESQLEQGW